MTRFVVMVMLNRFSKLCKEICGDVVVPPRRASGTSGHVIIGIG